MTLQRVASLCLLYFCIANLQCIGAVVSVKSEFELQIPNHIEHVIHNAEDCVWIDLISNGNAIATIYIGNCPNVPSESYLNTKPIKRVGEYDIYELELHKSNDKHHHLLAHIRPTAQWPAWFHWKTSNARASTQELFETVLKTLRILKPHTGQRIQAEPDDEPTPTPAAAAGAPVMPAAGQPPRQE